MIISFYLLYCCLHWFIALDTDTYHSLNKHCQCVINLLFNFYLFPKVPKLIKLSYSFRGFHTININYNYLNCTNGAERETNKQYDFNLVVKSYSERCVCIIQKQSHSYNRAYKVISVVFRTRLLANVLEGKKKQKHFNWNLISPSNQLSVSLYVGLSSRENNLSIHARSALYQIFWFRFMFSLSFRLISFFSIYDSSSLYQLQSSSWSS